MMCTQISVAHRCVLRFAHLIGRDSHEQNADTTGNEAIMVSLTVYIAICQFNNLWLLEGDFLSKPVSFRAAGGMALREHHLLLLNYASFPSLPRRYLLVP